MESLLDFAKSQFEPAKNILARDGELAPILIFEGERGLVLMAVPDYGNHQIKGIIREGMRKILQHERATRYAFVMEAWRGVGKSKTIPPNYSVSTDPDRTEALIVSAADNTGQKVTLMCPITRKDGKITFGEIDASFVGITGAILELLDGEPTVH